MNLPETYARVCAVRPGLAVAILEYDPDFASTQENRGWSIGTSRNFRTEVYTEVAAALILARWVEALPNEFSLYRRADGLWEIEGPSSATVEVWITHAISPTPLEALAAFYLKETT